MQNDKQRIIQNDAIPMSIRSLVRKYPTNQVNRLHYGGLPHLGNALWGAWSSHEIQSAADTYEDYSLSNNLQIPDFEEPNGEKTRLGGGSPARFMPYQLCLDKMKEAVQLRTLSDYPLAAGDNADKAPIIEYFNKVYSLKIHENNIIFSHSSTQAFTLIMEAILDYGDVVLMSAPNYGLFSFIPERVGGRVRLLHLSPSDNWKTNPSELHQRIIEINEELRHDYDVNRGKYIFRRSDIPPRVVAFININPHNPTGVVYGEGDRGLLLEISRLCKKEGVLVVDDLVYAGLEYDRTDPALPICSLDEQFDNTVTIYSLSKSYGLAGIRSGMVIANELVISLIRDKIFQLCDSLSVVQSSALAAVFSPNDNDINERELYLTRVTNEYYKRLVFVKAIILGRKNLSKSEVKILLNLLQVEHLVVNEEVDFAGIQGVDIVLEPRSGFFVLLDMTLLLGKRYKGFEISNDRSLLQFLYTSGNIKALTGRAFCWSNPDQLVMRVTTVLEYPDLLRSFLRLKSSVEMLI